ncbi:MAG: hypothetical protein GWN34_06910 [Gammaproteobacteria bacterium]|nr:hypothetical protein [Gammaproteobacteria bacterium]
MASRFRRRLNRLGGDHERAVVLRAQVRGLAMDLTAYRVLCGRMLLEETPMKAGSRKAGPTEVGMSRVMQTGRDRYPWRGGVAVFAPEDVTEEIGSSAVVRVGGVSMEVGEWPSAEVHRPSAVSTLVVARRDLRRRLRADEGADQRRGERP